MQTAVPVDFVHMPAQEMLTTCAYVTETAPMHLADRGRAASALATITHVPVRSVLPHCLVQRLVSLAWWNSRAVLRPGAAAGQTSARLWQNQVLVHMVLQWPSSSCNWS